MGFLDDIKGGWDDFRSSDAANVLFGASALAVGGLAGPIAGSAFGALGGTFIKDATQQQRTAATVAGVGLGVAGAQLFGGGAGGAEPGRGTGLFGARRPAAGPGIISRIPGGMATVIIGAIALAGLLFFGFRRGGS